MPNPIDRCGSCQQPLFIEANIPGGCECHDRDFRILLAQQRHRNNTGNEDFAASFVAQIPTPNLAEIDPSILMSAAGRNEFEAAQQLSGIRSRTPVAAMFDDVANYGPPGQEAAVVPQDDEIELGGEEDWTGDWDRGTRHNARVASTASRMDSIDLSAMWMQGTGIPFDRSQLVTLGGDDFSFDTGEMAVDTSAYPRGGGVGGGRFRVDQAPPARQGFNRGTIEAASGVEVSRVRAGRFEVIRERPVRPEPNIFEQVRAEAAPSPRPAPAPVSAVEQARAVQAKSRAPSVYDRLRTNPFK